MSAVNPIDLVRRKYLKNLAEYRKRNVIAYYSGWLQKPVNLKCSINDDDQNSFMAVINKMDRKKGLDLILHTPGGDIAAVEAIINYLRDMFNTDIECFIPQMAMSAGTMVACSTKKIFMGKQSSIGPFDPQLNGVPCHAILEEFNNAISEVATNPASLPIWQTIISKYHPTLLGECQKGIAVASEIVKKQLKEVMFLDHPDADNKAQRIIDALNNHHDTKMHARHLNWETAQNYGLNIELFEKEGNQQLQDLVLTVHHCYMQTFTCSKAIKIVENDSGSAVVTFQA